MHEPSSMSDFDLYQTIGASTQQKWHSAQKKISSIECMKADVEIKHAQIQAISEQMRAAKEQREAARLQMQMAKEGREVFLLKKRKLQLEIDALELL